MATAYETFGPCVPQVGTGVANALQTLGEATDGGNIAINWLRNPIKSDAGGDAAVDYQGMGVEATIDFDLTSFDDAVMDALLLRAEGGSTLGQGGPPGMLLGTNAKHCALYLPSALARPWYFPFCLIDNYNGKFGTRFGPKKVRFLAWRFVAGSATTSAAVPLYTRAAP